MQNVAGINNVTIWQNPVIVNQQSTSKCFGNLPLYVTHRYQFDTYRYIFYGSVLLHTFSLSANILDV